MKAIETKNVESKSRVTGALYNLACKLDGKYRRQNIHQLKKFSIEFKVTKINFRKAKRVRRPVKRKYFAAVCLLQRAFRIRKAKRNLRRGLLPNLEMMGLSPFLNFKH